MRYNEKRKQCPEVNAICLGEIGFFPKRTKHFFSQTAVNMVGTRKFEIPHCLNGQHCNSNLASLNHWSEEYW